MNGSQKTVDESTATQTRRAKSTIESVAPYEDDEDDDDESHGNNDQKHSASDSEEKTTRENDEL